MSTHKATLLNCMHSARNTEGVHGRRCFDQRALFVWMRTHTGHVSASLGPDIKSRCLSVRWQKMIDTTNSADEKVMSRHTADCSVCRSLHRRHVQIHCDVWHFRTCKFQSGSSIACPQWVVCQMVKTQISIGHILIIFVVVRTRTDRVVPLHDNSSAALPLM